MANNNNNPQDYQRFQDSEKETERASPNITEDAFTINGATLGPSKINYKEKKLPIIGNLPAIRQYQALVGVAVVSLVGLGIGAVINQQANNDKVTAENLASQVNAELQVFESKFKDVILGKSGALPVMLEQRNTVAGIREELEKMNAKIGSDYSLGLNVKLNQLLDKIRSSIAIVEKEKNTIADLEGRVKILNKQVGEMQAAVDNIQLGYVKQGVSENEAKEFILIKNAMTNIKQDMENMLLKESFAKEIPESLKKSREQVAKAIEAIYYGDKGVRPLDIDKYSEEYQKLASNFIYVANEVDSYVSYAKTLASIKGMVEENNATFKDLYTALQSASKNIGSHSKEGTVYLLFILFSVFFLISLLSLFFVYSQEKDRKAYLESLEHAKINDAIYLLVREMQPLQEGDLTQQTTEGNEIIGAIAGAVNKTVSSLSSLVKRIQEASLNMREKTNDVSLVAVEMLEVSEKQSSSIESTGSDVLRINNAITEISKRTAVTSKQAADSAEVAEAGAEQVYSAIKSMQSIDQNMTETSALMKNVSDSSKKITEILSLLSDITEQTNILALNATIQAAKAGDSGSGFKIVADSIQTLADRASDATRKVGALIGTVQTDIQSVGVAIAKTSEEVKNGVSLSEQAGESLNEMIMQSQTLAEIVEGVSNDTKHYAEMARKISSNMQTILESTRGNRESTKKTVDSITEIANISHSLGESAQKFRIE